MSQATSSDASSPDSAGPALHYEVIEGGTGPYLFMIHGMLSNRLQWTPNLDAVRRFARPVLIELWGHGLSPVPMTPEPYRVASYLRQIDSIRQSLGADRVLLCGQSFGACLTLRYSIEYASHVIAQIFTNSLSAVAPPDTSRSPQEREALARYIRMEGRVAIEGLPFHPRLARRLAPEVKQQLLESAAAADPEAIASALSVTGPELSVYASLGEIKCPTLLVNGLREGSFQEGRDLAEQLIPGCKVVDIPTAGHSVNLEAAEEFNAAITDFLGGLKLV